MRQSDPVTGGPEFIDFYNLSYEDARRMGLRVQSRGTGELKPFAFEFNDGTGVREAWRTAPDLSTTFSGAVRVPHAAADDEVVPLGQLKAVVAASSDFADFQSRIAALGAT
jgi:hypothetical protein